MCQTRIKTIIVLHGLSSSVSHDSLSCPNLVPNIFSYVPGDHKNEWAQRRLHEAQERVQHSAMFAIATVLSEGSTMTVQRFFGC